MFQTLYSKLAFMLMALFIALGAVMILASQKMIEAQRLFELTTDLIIGSVAFSLLAALIVFRFLTLRLRMLAQSIDAFRASGFARPVRLESANESGDEIDRLSAAFQEMSERIAAQLAKIEHVDQLRRELLANVSHDLRTPLTSMQGYVETMLMERQHLSAEENRQYLQIVGKHCERLSRLIHDLFELTKLEACEVLPQMETFPITELAQDVVQKFSLTAKRSGLSLTTSYQQDRISVCADIGMVERVLNNLIENAMRFTPEGGEVCVGIRPAGERVELCVSDTGKGIDPEELSNIFERYYRADRRDRASVNHAGLGLAIARRIVELHSGEIQVESAPNRGTTFIVALPTSSAQM